MLVEYNFFVDGDKVPLDYDDIIDFWESRFNIYFHVRIDLLSGRYVFKVVVDEFWSFPDVSVAMSFNCCSWEVLRYHE